MKFVFPNRDYEQKAIDYIQEFHVHQSQPHGVSGLDRCLKDSSYADWLDKLQKDLDIANIPKDRVPAITYFYVREDDSKIVGIINIRLALNDFLRSYGGHIGYSIRPTERRRGYGTRMLSEALEVCKIIGLNRLILTCDKENPASANVIRSNGGILEAEYITEFSDSEIQRYIINN